VASVDDLFGGPAAARRRRTATGVAVFAIERRISSPGRPGLYLGSDGKDWAITPTLRRSRLLRRRDRSRAAPRLASDVVHAHDWHAGLAPAYLALSGARRPATVQTIHNIAFQGNFPAEAARRVAPAAVGFPHRGRRVLRPDRLPEGSLHFAESHHDREPTYAREIQTPEHGMGLNGLLHHRARPADRILNGIDEMAWNPVQDPHIPSRYCDTRLADKAPNKAALQERLGLKSRHRGPCFAS